MPNIFSCVSNLNWDQILILLNINKGSPNVSECFYTALWWTSECHCIFWTHWPSGRQNWKHSFLWAVYSLQNPVCLKLNAVALSTRHPREGVHLKSRELQKHNTRSWEHTMFPTVPKVFFFQKQCSLIWVE